MLTIQKRLVIDPISFDEAINEPEWCKVIDEELQDIKKNETWDLIKLPEEKNVIGLKWVCRSKYHANGKIQNFKARLVAKGHAQQEGVDFDETLSHVAHFETVRVFLALAVQLEWPV